MASTTNEAMNTEKKVKIQLSTELSDKDWKALRAFCEKSDRLIKTKLLTTPQSINASIRYKRGVGFSYITTLPPEHEIAEFILAFRFFFAKKEPTNYSRVINILGRRTDDPMARKVFRAYKDEWKHALFGKAMTIEINNVKLTSELLLDLWINAHYFHADEAKKERLDELKEALSDNFVKYMLLEAMLKASQAVLRVYDAIKEMVDSHFDTGEAG